MLKINTTQGFKFLLNNTLNNRFMIVMNKKIHI